jgi:hypothetical protein
VLVVVAILLIGAGVAFAVWRTYRGEPVSDPAKGPELLVQAPAVFEGLGNGADKTPPPSVTPGPEKDPAKKKEGPPSESTDVDIADVKPPKKAPTPPVVDVTPKSPVVTPDEKDPPKVPDPPAVPVVVPAPPIAPGVDAEAINAAIDRGVRYLKQTQLDNGSWPGASLHTFFTGYAALGGLALLECKVPANDPAVQKAAQFVRSSGAGLGHTYEISAAILFLDRLGDTKDRELIQSLAMRLLAGQRVTGGWTYECPTLTAEQSQQMQQHLRTHWPWSPVRPKPAAGAKDGKQEMPAVDLWTLTPQQLQWNPSMANQPGTGDNSNTQFALLALWAARRHGVAAECPILLSYKRYINTQNADGGWGYVYFLGAGPPVPLPQLPMPQLPPPQPGGLPPPQPGGLPPPAGGQPPAGGGPMPGFGMADVMNSRPTMTCVGLLGLAMGNGMVADAAKGKVKRKEDPAIPKGLALLGKSVGKPAPEGAKPPMQNLYLLWSIERVAVLYDLKTIGGNDWYGWGAQILLANQAPAGNWTGGQYQGSCEALDTCFSLLFLKRSNLVPELTENLRLHMVIRDPVR